MRQNLQLNSIYTWSFLVKHRIWVKDTQLTHYEASFSSSILYIEKTTKSVMVLAVKSESIGCLCNINNTMYLLRWAK